jgi:hypothetical protein
MTDLTMSAMIKKLLTGGYKRRIFASFDRNRYPDSRQDEQQQTALSHRLILSERYIRQISKSLGFNQIMMSSVSSMDIAEVCLYNSAEQPGLRAVYSLYPSKSYRIYICQFLVGENLVPFPPAFSIPEDRLFKDGVMHPRPPRVGGSKYGKSRLNNFADAAYSYGVRLRNMQDEFATQFAITESETTFRENYGEKELQKLQSKLDSKSASSSVPSYFDPKLMSFYSVREDPGNEEFDPVKKIIKEQEEIETRMKVPLIVSPNDTPNTMQNT